MFDRLARSWQFAKISYGIIWDFKQLLVFPLMSTLACLAVLASFLAPLWMTGAIDVWAQQAGSKTTPSAADQVALYSLLFVFYFCNYFVIVFFNTALAACALKVVGGEAPSIRGGLEVAWHRLTPILGWAFLSAVVGMLLQSIENSNKKAGRLVAALIGSAWSALTYFVVPILVIEGTGPIESIRRSTKILKETWGEAVGGQFSLGLLSLLIVVPLAVALVALAYLASAGNPAAIAVAVCAGVVLLLVAAAFTSAASVVMKALIYNFATGRTVPENLDRELVAQAFLPKG